MATRRSTMVAWWRGKRRQVETLPGRPPAGPAAGPLPESPGSARPARRVRAVCCSGGGIRAAAFSLGGLQGLSRRPVGRPGWLDEVDLITAVSGGSYIASSYAMVNHSLTPADRVSLPAYAPGSPEDNRLRAHTRYLVEDSRAAAVGVLSIVYGLVLNLLPILAGLFLLTRLLGWFLSATGLLQHSATEWQVRHSWAGASAAAVPACCAVLVYAADRLRDIYVPPDPQRSEQSNAWTLRLLGLAVGCLALLVGVPWFLRQLTTTRLDVTPGTLDWRSQVTGFLATATAIVGLVKTTLGRFKTKLVTTPRGRSGKATALTGRAVRAVAPWAGSAVVVGLLGIAFVAWTSASAYTGLTAGQVVGCVVAAVVIIGWRLITDVNRNSVHAFYRSRLASAFAVSRVGDRAEQLPYHEPVHFRNYVDDRPQLIVCAAVNTNQQGAVPSGRGCAPWTFGARWTGITSGTMFDGEPGDPTGGRMIRTADYERLAGERMVTIPAAVAVSGAAVSPVMGRMTRAPLRLLLGVSNVRLGLWLPNPLRSGDLEPAPTFAAQSGPDLSQAQGLRDFLKWQWRQPGVRALLAEMFGRTGLDGRWVYVTDGGHYENLGLIEALRRGATEIVVFDASGDLPHSWSTFGEAVETARADLGVEIDLNPSTMAPPTGSVRSPTMVVAGTCTYANGVQARLWLCKLTLPDEAPWDVLAWANSHPEFPHDSTGQQLYGDREFEAYRRLGEVAALTATKLYYYRPNAADHADRSIALPRDGEPSTAEARA